MLPHTVLVLETEHYNEEDRVEQGDSKGYKVVERPVGLGGRELGGDERGGERSETCQVPVASYIR